MQVVGSRDQIPAGVLRTRPDVHSATVLASSECWVSGVLCLGSSRAHPDRAESVKLFLYLVSRGLVVLVDY